MSHKDSGGVACTPEQKLADLQGQFGDIIKRDIESTNRSLDFVSRFLRNLDQNAPSQEQTIDIGPVVELK